MATFENTHEKKGHSGARKDFRGQSKKCFGGIKAGVLSFAIPKLRMFEITLSRRLTVGIQGVEIFRHQEGLLWIQE